MEQLSLLDWLDNKRVIIESLPAKGIQERTFIIKQLKPIFAELEALGLDDFAISEAMAYYRTQYHEKGQQQILKTSASNNLQT